MGVVVTGVGVVSALGADPQAFRGALLDGVNACRMHKWECFDGSVVRAPAYVALKPDPEGLIEPRKLRRMFRLVRMACVSARQALKQAGVNHADMDPSRLGVVFGTSLGAMEVTQKFIDSWIENGEAAASPLQFMNSVHGILASQIALDIQATGVNLTTAQRDICFEAALDTGVRTLETGQTDVVLVGGADELTPMLHEFGRRTYQVATDDRDGLDPWGARNGVVPGDGAGVVVLERDDTPRSPLARVIATRVGRTRGDVFDEVLKNAGHAALDLITNNLDGGTRLARLHGNYKEGSGGVPQISHRGNFGTYPSAGALQFVANTLMLANGEYYEPLADGKPSGHVYEAPKTILHNAPSISGNHAAYVLGK